MSPVARRVTLASVVGIAILLAFGAWLLTAPGREEAPSAGTTASPSALRSTSVSAAPTRVILTPTATPTTSQSFSWLAGDESHTAGYVQIRSSESDVRTVDAETAGTVNGDPRRHFSATVTRLRPAATYEYRVGLEGSWSRWWEFSTADPDRADFSFIYYGDAQFGLDSTWPSVVRMAEETAPDAIGSVHAGDLVNGPTHEGEWAAWFEGMGRAAATANVMAAPGNHEYDDDPQLLAWKANFEYPRNGPTIDSSGPLAALAVGDSDVARQYAAYFRHWTQVATETVYFTDYQDVRFVAVNATRDEAFLTPADLPACAAETCPSRDVGKVWVQFQASWLDRVLADSPSTWTVVTFHQPVYSASEGRDEPVLREYWVPILEERDVDLVLMGHDHVYARGYKDEDATARSGVTDGPVYVVSNSGAKHYELSPETDNVWTANGATQVRRGEGVTTYQVIDVSEDRLVYRSYLADKTPESTTGREVGAVFDEFTIAKTEDGDRRVIEGVIDSPPAP